MEVATGLHAIKSTYAANKPLWVYVLDGDFCLWVDVGINITPEDSVIPYLKQSAPALWAKRPVALITHADVDHFGGLTQLRRNRPETLAWAHQADKLWIESEQAVLRERYRMHADDGIDLPAQRQATLLERGGGGGKVDLALQGGEVIDLGAGGQWTVLHVPGHSAGHLTLWDARRRWAIIGDAALDWGVPNDDGKIIAPPPYYDVDAYERTVLTLLSLKAERVFTSHYGILDRASGERLYCNSLSAVAILEKSLLAVMETAGASGLTLADLCTRVGAHSARWEEALWPGLADPISAHLKRLISMGKTRREGRASGVFYRMS